MPEPCPNHVGASGWTIETLKCHFDTLRAADRAADKELHVEWDRRISEGATLRERALTVKEVADKEALRLSRENQNYKDEKADKLRDQSMTERGAYVTRADLTGAIERIESSLKPLFDFVSNQKGVVQGSQLTTAKLFGFIAAGGAIAGVMFKLIDMLAK